MSPRLRVAPAMRRIVGIGSAGLLVAVAIGLAVAPIEPGRTADRAATPSDPPARTSGARSGTPVPTAAASTTAPPTEPSTVVSRPTPSGPGLTEPGISLRFSPRSDGGFDVAEQVILREPVTRIALRVPPRRAAGDAFTGSRPAVTALQMQDERGQPLTPTRLGSQRQPVTVRLTTATTGLKLRYVLSGTAATTATTGRALAFLRPVTAAIDPTLPVRISSAGTGVSTLRCPQLPASEQACALGVPPTLAAGPDLTAATSTVIVRLDAPAP